MSIEVANESGMAADETALVSVSRYALDRLGINPLAELSILLVDVETMTDLHVKWMDEPGPTDVMSFPMDELSPREVGVAPSSGREEATGPGPALLGDVVLCPAVAADQASGAGHSLDDELHLLTVHGVLHLLGYDHAEPADEREMFRLQNELLDAWREERAATARRHRIAAADDALLGTAGLTASRTKDDGPGPPAPPADDRRGTGPGGMDPRRRHGPSAGAGQ